MKHSVMATTTLLQILLLVALITIESAANISLPGCPDSCSAIPLPYPFGVGPKCSISKEFSVNCTADGVPYLSGMKILNINLSLGQTRLNSPISYHCYNATTKKVDSIAWDIFFDDAPFWLNTEKNKFIVTGFNTLAHLQLDENNYTVGCHAKCQTLDNLNKHGGSCSGTGCCQTPIPEATKFFFVDFDDAYNNSNVYNISPCGYAMVMEDAAFVLNTTYTTNKLLHQNVPIVVDWSVGNTTCEIAQTNKSSYACKSSYSVCLNSSNGGYICNCSHGYEGNPYLEGGCQDIDECATQNPCSKPGTCHNLPGGYRCSCPFGRRKNVDDDTCQLNLALVIGSCIGIIALSFLGFAIYFIRERRDLSRVKHKYFQQHGGWILLEKIKSTQGFGFTIFTKQQIEQATNNFDSANIIGRGGQGTVYKGILRDQIVAIKKCKIVDESKKKEFGKEMLILSQINHKNIVKILGCCLEVDVPILVYEFICNGTLFHYIHHKKEGSQVSLTTRLKIAHEAAEALAYLHTSASPPIFHGDVKSANILLDQNYIAKVSDFGASVLAPTDEAQFVTFVQGTLGYLDPEYMQTSQLTDKSDVYSFGVVLLELLTSKPVINYDPLQEGRNLSSRFLSAMKENKIQELLDDDIKHEDDMELIRKVAELAKECLSMKGEERPMMKEVAEELHRIGKLKQHPWGQEYQPEEIMICLGERSCRDIEIEHTYYYFNVDKEAMESIAAGR